MPDAGLTVAILCGSYNIPILCGSYNIPDQRITPIRIRREIVLANLLRV